MSNELQKVPVSMVRNNLNGILSFDLPKDYSVRWYKPGDEKLWLHIQSKADKYNIINLSLYTKTFGHSMESLPNRQCFLMDRFNNAVGTATAWFNEDYNGTRYGRVHWVAILPERQGQGLAKPLMSMICNRLGTLGHNKAYLTTLSIRIPAINLYRKFGFYPEIRSDEDTRIWRAIEAKLKAPFNLG